MNCTTPFDNRIVHTPETWRGPIVEVIDTFETVKIGLECIGIDDPDILVEAVKLVLSRYDKTRAVYE